MKKKFIKITLTATLSLVMAGTSFAGEWQWIDGNGDGTAECYYMENGTPLTNTTTPDGYQVDGNGAWIVDGVVQTQKIGQTASSVKHNAGYDPAHPLAGKIDEWNLRLTDQPTLIGGFDICGDGVQALLTRQMDYYNSHDIANYAPLIDGVYTATRNGTTFHYTKEDYDEGKHIEQALYQWFCDWLNGMDFENMSEMEKAKEIQKVMAKIQYEVETTGYTRRTYYRTLIEQRGMCGEAAMTACSLAKALGLKAAVSGTGNHAVYYIQVDNVAYFGQNADLNLDWPTPDHVFFQ